MTPQERELLTNLIGRLRQAPAQAKDQEADQLIAQLVAIRDSELKANKEMREKYERLKEEILINQFGNPEKPPAKKPEK